MAKLFFVGGYRVDDSLRPFFRQAALELGYYAAQKGHTIVVGSENESTLDYHVVQGLKKYLNEQSGRSATLDLRYAERSTESYVSLAIPGLKKSAEVYPRLELGTHKHLLAHMGALDASDVAFAIGGAEGTYRTGAVAMMLGKPILALRAFGGSGRLLYDILRTSYLTAAHKDQRYSLLGRSWDGEETAVQLVSLAEDLALQRSEKAARPGSPDDIGPTHSYFISYSWKNVKVADHIELLLRRRQRIVIRDQTHIPAGGTMDEVIQRQIDSADTFLALYSTQFQGSDWCPNELDYALDRNKQGKNPRRVVAITLDGQVPFRLRTDLRSTGNDREKRELAIDKLIREEP
jgi:hypothetical protein